jgi:hypothetical protein
LVVADEGGKQRVAWSLKTSAVPQPRLAFKPGKAKEEAAEPVERPKINDISREDVLAAIRELYRQDPAPCGREELLELLRDHLGFGALGKNIRQALEGDLLAAVRRGILVQQPDGYAIYCRTIENYHRDLLKKTLLSVVGRTWTSRDDAMVLAARHLGFARTGTKIKAAFKSIINGLIRTGKLETDGGSCIRAS